MSSVWEIDNMPKFESLGEDLEADVCIIGGGMAGVWCACMLSKEGKKVVLLEADKLGQSATLYTTAFITEVLDTSFEELTEMFGSETSELVRQSGAEAIELIERAVREEKIDCEFARLPIQIYEDLKDLHKSPLEKFDNQAKFHPMKFLKGLTEAAQSNGAKFYEHTEAKEIKEEGGMLLVSGASGKSVKVRDVIVATYEPFNNPKATHFKKGLYVSYVLALELASGALAEGLYLDTENPYHYVRVDDLGQSMRMIVGGEDHRAEIKFEDRQSFKALEKYVQQTFPNLKYKITNKWHGGILESSDGLALIGSYSPHQYVASAFSGNGMTYSAISARILTDLIFGKGSQYESIYDPRRALKTSALLHKARDYTEEFFGGAVKNLFE